MRAAVFDIEGTVCPISFVKDTLFPYALKKVHELVPAVKFPLTGEQEDPIVPYLREFPDEYAGSAEALLNHIDDLTARDVKAPYLKSLQGYLWKFGYECGEIKAPVYADALAAFRRLREQSIPIFIYSSGSVPAQKLLFSHCDSDPSDVTPTFEDYFDTVNAGPKTDQASYRLIAEKVGVPAQSIMFFSDNPLEIQAARGANWQATLVVRPGNAPLPDEWSKDSSLVYNLDHL